MLKQLSRMATLIALVLLAFAPAYAQEGGRITGSVTSQDGQPLSGAYIVVMGTRYSAFSGRDGSFVIPNVPAGSYTLRVSHLSFKDVTVADVAVTAGADAAIAPSLVPQPVGLDEVVASATRRAQRTTDAPATITKLNADVIANSVGNSFSGALKEVIGIDYIQVGVTAAAINARGFNSSFNNRMLMMEDGRLAVLPENGLPVGTFTTIPKLDLASVEVLVGPGAALYGPDASNGVVTLTTKDPRTYPGASFEIAGGNRSYYDIQGRYAGVSGKFGYKITGEHQSANDWSNTLKYGTAQRVETGVGGKVNWDSRVTRGGGALYYYMGESQLEATAGMSVSDGVGQTNVGRNQLDNWQYNLAQIKFTSPHWYASAYRTQSKAGDSYALNRYTDNKALNPTKSDEELRLMSDWPSDGQMYAAELQGNFSLPALKTKVTAGGQFRNDVVSSDRQWLTDRLTGEDLSITQKGVYGQIETQLLPKLTLTAAARYDDHENYDAQFSPKAALVFKPLESQALRVTFNRAFKAPTTLQTNFYIPDFAPVVAGTWVGVHGNTRGFIVKNATGATIASYKPLVPEENTTWEVGYKGVLADRFMIDVTGYQAKYDNFLSPLGTISNSLLGQVAYFADNDERVDNTTARQLVLTYWNLGQAKLKGVDAGFKWLASRKLDVSGTVSFTDLTSVDTAGASGTVGQKVEALSLNAPVTKWTVGAQGHGLFRNFDAGFTARHVTGYYFRSGINNNWVPTFNTLDLNFSYALPAWRSSINAQVVNAYSCVATYTTTPVAATGVLTKTGSESSCGFDERHQEMVNMPALGTMFFLGIRYTR